MIEEMVKELKLTTKRNAKIDILKKYFDADSEIKNIVKRCYDPFEKFYVTSVKTSIVGNKHLSDVYSHLHKVLDQISSRQVTGNLAKETVIRFVNELSAESQKVFISILNKDLHCGIGHETINAASPNLIEQFSVQLANKYNAEKNYNVDFWYGSHKYDGIRCIYQNKYPGVIHTREGSELVGFEHIIADLETLIERMKEDPAFALFSENEYFVDGELFVDGISFNDIQGIVLSTKNVDIKQKRKVYLKVFAIGPVKETSDMIRFFDEKTIFRGLCHLRPINYVKVKNDPNEISRITREYVAEGYEGLMLRHPYVAYDWKRSNNLLKSKLHKETEAELTIVGYNPGREGTKYENTFGAFKCLGTVTDPLFSDGKRVLGTFEVSCVVGSGFSDAEREEIWKDPDYYIGKEIIVNYQSMSQEASSGKYSLRFPIKKKDGLKLDRTNEF